MAHTPVTQQRSHPEACRGDEPEAAQPAFDAAFVRELRKFAPRDWATVATAAGSYLDARGIQDLSFRKELIRNAAMVVATNPPVCHGPALTARVLAVIDRTLSERSADPAPSARSEQTSTPAAEADGTIVHCPPIYGRRPMQPQRLDYPRIVPTALRDAVIRVLAVFGLAPSPVRRS